MADGRPSYWAAPRTTMASTLGRSSLPIHLATSVVVTAK